MKKTAISALALTLLGSCTLGSSFPKESREQEVKERVEEIYKAVTEGCNQKDGDMEALWQYHSEYLTWLWSLLPDDEAVVDYNPWINAQDYDSVRLDSVRIPEVADSTATANVYVNLGRKLDHPQQQITLKLVKEAYGSDAPGWYVDDIMADSASLAAIINYVLVEGLDGDIPEQEAKGIRQLNDFAFRFYRRLRADAGAMDNMICSPLSVACLLGMLGNGAEGATLEEISQTLGMDRGTANLLMAKTAERMKQAKEPAIVDMASNMTVGQQYKLRDDFCKTIRKGYQSLVARLDFGNPATVDSLNSWCSHQTHGMIDQILTPADVDGNTLMALVNAIYFKARWAAEFKKKDTHPEPFTNADGRVVNLPMMHQTSYFRLGIGQTYTALRMDYKDCPYAMVIVLPRKGHTVEELAAQTTGETWQQLLGGMQIAKVEVKVPRLEAQRRTYLMELLAAMGMPTAFTEKADFSAMMATSVPVLINKVIHEARVRMDEEGSEAAAVTIATMGIGAASVKTESVEPYRFYADRPFLYTIIDKERSTILFMGEYRGDAKAATSSEKPREVKEQSLRHRESTSTKREEDAPPLPNTDFFFQEDKVFDVVEQMPEFPGGMPALMAYIEQERRPLQSGLQGRVIVHFVVRKDGSLSHPEVIRSLSPEADREALRVVRSMPKWEPGRRNGRPVDVKYTVPVTFK